MDAVWFSNPLFGSFEFVGFSWLREDGGRPAFEFAPQYCRRKWVFPRSCPTYVFSALGNRTGDTRLKRSILVRSICMLRGQWGQLHALRKCRRRFLGRLWPKRCWRRLSVRCRACEVGEGSSPHRRRQHESFVPQIVRELLRRRLRRTQKMCVRSHVLSSFGVLVLFACVFACMFTFVW